MTTALVVEMSVAVNNNSPIQDYVHPDDHTQPTYKFLWLTSTVTVTLWELTRYKAYYW